MLGQFDESDRFWRREDWSLGLGRVFGTSIRISHWFLVLVVAQILYTFIRSPIPVDELLRYQLPAMTILFISVLLHEFGHVLSCKTLGGTADEILIWPLGGLAYCEPQHRPTDHLVVAIAGPFINAVIAFLSATTLFIMGVPVVFLLNPLASTLLDGLDLLNTPITTQYVVMIFKINWILLLVNLLPMIPLDGSKIWHSILWQRSTELIATMYSIAISLIAGFIIFCVGLWLHQVMLIALAIITAYCCYRTWLALQHDLTIEESEFGYDFSEGFTSFDRAFERGEERPPRMTFRQRINRCLKSARSNASSNRKQPSNSSWPRFTKKGWQA